MLALFLLCVLCGCVALPPAMLEYDASAAVELTGVPFYAQKRYQCGPAALASLLEYSGAAVSPGALVHEVYLPGREGSLQAELMAATRGVERIPYRVEAGMAALVAELDAGRPVLVLQNLGVGWLPRWHYAVVVGVDAQADALILRSGTEERRITRVRTFLNTWRRSDYWGFVALAPGEMPANPRPERYFEAVAGLEETGHLAAARAGWEAGRRQWPQSPVALFGQANTQLLAEDWAAAEVTYRQLLQHDPLLVAARNNLAISLLRQGRVAEAESEARAALEQAGDNAALRAAIEDTLAEVVSAADHTR